MTAELIKKLNAIADKKIFGATNKNRFKVFAKHFWGNRIDVDTTYVDDWVRRFNQNEEYVYADYARLDILVDHVDGITNAKTRARKQFEGAGWNKAYVEERLSKLYKENR